MKWVKIFFKTLAVLMLTIVAIFYFSKEIRMGLIWLKMHAQGERSMQITTVKNRWDIIDFSDIPGETKYHSRIDDKFYPALEKYRIWDIAIFEDVGFVLADNEEEVINKLRKQYKPPTKINTLFKSYELVQAHIFRSTDRGRHFEKIILGKGSATGLIKRGSVVYVVVEHRDTHTATLYLSEDNGKKWQKLFDISKVETFKGVGITQEGNAILLIRKSREKQFYLYIYNKGTNQAVPLENAFQQMFYDREGKPEVVLWKEKLLFAQKPDGNMRSIDLNTKDVETYSITLPENKILWHNGLKLNKETGEPYFILRTKGKKLEEDHDEIYFPMTKRYVRFPYFNTYMKLHVAGSYIGGFIRMKGILTHIYTTNEKEWYYELLPDYLLGPYDRVGVGYGQIWMVIDAIYNLNLVSQKGVYLAIGEIGK